MGHLGGYRFSCPMTNKAEAPDTSYISNFAKLQSYRSTLKIYLESHEGKLNILQDRFEILDLMTLSDFLGEVVFTKLTPWT